MNNLLLNDLLVTENIKDALFSMEEGIAAACENKAVQICKELFPNVNFAMQENIDLVIRPLSSVIALNELLLQNIFSESSLDGIVSSATIPKDTKVMMLKNFASLNGINTASNDPESLYSEIGFFLKNNNINNESVLSSSILTEMPSIDRLFFSDQSNQEMERNRVPYVQIDHLKVMDFNRSEFNRGTLINGAYDRGDYQTFQDYKESDNVVLPGMLDVYFSTGLVKEDVEVVMSNGMYTFPDGYYIDISSSKNMAISENDMMANGVTKFSPSVFVESGEATETFQVVKYIDPDFESFTRTDDFVVSDTLFKGFYPLFLNLDAYSKQAVVLEDLTLAIEEYLDSISGSVKMMSLNDMHDFVATKGMEVTFAAKNTADLFLSTGMATSMDVLFPLTMKDISIPPELRTTQVSEKTIKLFAGDINVTQE